MIALDKYKSFDTLMSAVDTYEYSDESNEIFDACEAWYCFLSSFHDGQWSEKYAQLCRLEKYFQPRQSLLSARTLEPDAKELYRALAARERRARKK